MDGTKTAVADSDTQATSTGRGGDSHDELRRAVARIESDGWDGPAGIWLMAELEQRCPSWAVTIDQRCARRPGTTSPADVLSACWSTITRFAENVMAADAPWAYLWKAVSNALAVDIAADSLLSTREPRRRHPDRPDRVLRIGFDVHHLDAVHVDDHGPAQPQLSAAGMALVAILAGGDLDRMEFWVDAVDRALDVMASARRSYEETALRRDPYLLHQLDLTPEELSALAALLIGPRRGDRASQSLLLALRRDPTAPIDSVPGAVRRVLLLRSHRVHPPRSIWPPTAA